MADKQPTNPRAILYRKIAAVTAAMQRVPKNGENKFHNYKYTTESDLTDAIRSLLFEHGLAFLPPSVISHERIPTESKQGPLTRVHMRFALACTDTGEVIESELWADGQDAADKGFYKAYTGGVKYFLMKTFLVSTGDDPEQDDQPRPAPVQTRQQSARAPLPTEQASDDPAIKKAKDRIKAITGTASIVALAQWLGESNLQAPTTTDEWLKLASWCGTVATERAKGEQRTA